jgi:hypothetical protein
VAAGPECALGEGPGIAEVSEHRIVQLDGVVRRREVPDRIDVRRTQGGGERASQRYAVRADTPLASAPRPTGQPCSIRCTKNTRPEGVRRAFSWTFIRGALLKVGGFTTTASQHPLE